MGHSFWMPIKAVIENHKKKSKQGCKQLKIIRDTYKCWSWAVLGLLSFPCCFLSLLLVVLFLFCDGLGPRYFLYLYSLYASSLSYLISYLSFKKIKNKISNSHNIYFLYLFAECVDGLYYK
jgi:hypothetical protein